MAAYLIVYARIDDPAGFAAYVEAVQPLIAAYGGRLVARNSPPEVLEGSLPWQTTAVLEFDSAARIREFWYSPDYVEVKRLREGAAEFQVALVDGLPPA
jgi:uncharacterized protein (DUF1330 family)